MSKSREVSEVSAFIPSLTKNDALYGNSLSPNSRNLNESLIGDIIK